MNVNTNLAVSWEKKMLKAGKKFARLLTTKAIYDKVAIIDSNASNLVFQWLKGTQKRKNINSANCGNESFRVTQETISKASVQNIQYYRV